MSAVLRVLSGGVLTTVQNHGRLDQQRYGVPIGGAMDWFALEAANRLVGNMADAAALEITAGGAAFDVLTPLLLALTGADLGVTIDEEPLALWTAVFARAGMCIRVAGRSMDWGARAYLAIAGGLDVPQVLGSRSTCLPGGFGGLEGRPLRVGDLLTVRINPGGASLPAGRHWPEIARPRYRSEPALRILPGPHPDHLAPDTLQLLLAHRWEVGASSNRMGYRLEGPQLQTVRAAELASMGVFPGVVQVPPDGVPILLMADAQPTGGYPIAAVVITPDLPLAAQLLPGDSLRFVRTTLEQAHAAWRTVQQWCETELQDDDTVPLLAWAGA